MQRVNSRRASGVGGCCLWWKLSLPIIESIELRVCEQSPRERRLFPTVWHDCQCRAGGVGSSSCCCFRLHVKWCRHAVHLCVHVCASRNFLPLSPLSLSVCLCLPRDQWAFASG